MAAQRGARGKKVDTGKAVAPARAKARAKASSAVHAKPPGDATRSARVRARSAGSKQSTTTSPGARSRKTARAVRAVKARVRGGEAALGKVRKICAAWPETSEKEAWGTPTFRVRDKMFAMYADDHHGDGRVAIWCKAGLGVQEALVATDAVSFFVPPYVGVKGWIGVRLDVDVDWDEIGDILADAYQMTAPPKLAATLGPKAKPS